MLVLPMPGELINITARRPTGHQLALPVPGEIVSTCTAHQVKRQWDDADDMACMISSAQQKRM